MNLLDISKIKIPNTIEVHVATIISENVAYLLSIFDDHTFKIFLAPLWHLANFVKAIEFVLGIMELQLSRHLLVQSSHQCV
jgi:hypothetical protein